MIGRLINKKPPKILSKYFWDCYFEELDLDKHLFFIAERLLNYGNIQAIRWLIKEAGHSYISKVIKKSRCLDAKTKNYWKLMYAK